jgi:hypothetical protein
LLGLGFEHLSKSHPTVGHQGFIKQFIALIVPTHYKCLAAAHWVRWISSDFDPLYWTICCSFLVQNEGTLVVANSTRSCDSNYFSTSYFESNLIDLGQF